MARNYTRRPANQRMAASRGATVPEEVKDEETKTEEKVAEETPETTEEVEETTEAPESDDQTPEAEEEQEEASEPAEGNTEPENDDSGDDSEQESTEDDDSSIDPVDKPITAGGRKYKRSGPPGSQVVEYGETFELPEKPNGPDNNWIIERPVYKVTSHPEARTRTMVLLIPRGTIFFRRDMTA